MKKRVILFALFLVVMVSFAFALDDDVLIDGAGNVATGVTNSDANFEKGNTSHIFWQC